MPLGFADWRGQSDSTVGWITVLFLPSICDQDGASLPGSGTDSNRRCHEGLVGVSSRDTLPLPLFPSKQLTLKTKKNRAGSHVSQAGIELPVWLGMTLDSLFS